MGKAQAIDQHMHVGAVRRSAEVAKQHPWVKVLFRLGYAAKGLVYIIIGIVAVQVAVGSGQESTGPKGALQIVAGLPFGQAYLVVIGVALLGYVLWRFAQAGLDTEGKGTDAKGIIARAGMLGSGVVYLGLALTALSYVGFSSGSGSGSREALIAKVLGWPGGTFLVVAAGVIFMGVSLLQFKKAWDLSFMKDYKQAEMTAKEKKFARLVGRWGYLGRGVIFIIIGGFIAYSGYTANPDQAKGTKGALQLIVAQPYGTYVLLLTAIGLVAYGIYCGTRAKYREF